MYYRKDIRSHKMLKSGYFENQTWWYSINVDSVLLLLKKNTNSIKLKCMHNVFKD